MLGPNATNCTTNYTVAGHTGPNVTCHDTGRPSLPGAASQTGFAGTPYSDGIPGVVKSKRRWMSHDKIAHHIKNERAKQGLNDLGTGPREKAASAAPVEKWAEKREDPATWKWSMSSFLPGLPGAAAASTAEEKVCRLGESCDTPMSPPAARTVEFLKEQAAKKGFEVEISPSLQKRADRSLDGVIVLIGDVAHNSKSIRDDMEAMITSNWQGGAWFLGPSKDDILVEGPCDRWYFADWNNRYLYGYECKNIELPAYTKAFAEAKDKMDNLAQAFLKEHGRAVGNDWYTRHAQAGALYDELKRKRGGLSETARAWDLAEREAQRLTRDLEGERENYHLSRALEHHGPDHATFVVLGRVHTDHLRDAVFDQPAVYIRTKV